MAKITKVITVCDGCQSETETAGFRVGVATGNTRSLDLCPACQGRPFGEIVGAVGNLRIRGRGSNARPAVASMEQIEAAAKAAEEAKAKAKPRVRASRKAAAPAGNLKEERAARNKLLSGKMMFPPKGATTPEG